MWRRLLKVILYTSLVIGTLGGIGLMVKSENITLGFVTIIVVWLSASVFGLVLEIATDISKIAVSNESIKDSLQNLCIFGKKSNDIQVPETELEEKKPVVEEDIQKEKLSSTWTCKCGKKNPLKNNFCTECGEKKP